MIIQSRFTKKAPALGPKLAKSSPSALVEAARRRRQRVLKPINPDPFSSRHAARSAQRLCSARSLRYSPVCTSGPSEKVVPELSPIKQCARNAHPCLVDVFSGMDTNAVVALQMPERLQRPDLQETLPETIKRAGYASDSVLKGLEIVRRELVKNGEQLFAAIASTAIQPIVATHTRELPPFVAIRAPNKVQPEHLPTHMLAVHNGQPDVKVRKVIAVPVHASVLAAHCSRVPSLPTPTAPTQAFDPNDSSDTTHKRVIPLVPFSIPSPSTFALVMQFLCTQDAKLLFRILLPLPNQGKGVYFSALARHLANTFTGASLVSQALRVYGVWQNACSLGVLNPQIWQVIDILWKGYRDAILLARR